MVNYKELIDVSKKISNPFSREIFIATIKEEFGEGFTVFYDMGNGIAVFWVFSSTYAVYWLYGWHWLKTIYPRV